MKKNCFIFLILVVLLVTGCTTGSVIVTGERRKAIPVESVKIYPKYPEECKTIGIVSSKAEIVTTQQEAVDRAVKELKEQAAKVGANGIVIKGQGGKSASSGTYISTGAGTGVVTGSIYEELTAEAIYVP